MRLFDRFKKKDNSEEVKKKVVKKGLVFKSLMFVVGAFLSAVSFNLFYVPNNFVGGGLGGVAIILNHFFPVNSTVVMVVGNLLFSIISIFTLGYKKSLRGILGACVYTAFVYATEDIVSVMNFSFDNILLYVIAAGVVGGFGESLVYKAGFNTGGTSIIAQVITHYTKQSLGSVLRILSYMIIIGGGFTFGYTAIMYSILITVISTSLVDKILIGISEFKIVYIKTTKEEEVIDFIINIIKSGVTELESKGIYSKRKDKTFMCVVPTERYNLLKSAVMEIDPEAFIVISDCYEAVGGTKKRIIEFND